MRIAVIYGANASGKTNFLKALAFVSWFVQASWQVLNRDDETTVQPFAFHDDRYDPSEFDVVTEDRDGCMFSYRLVLTRHIVVEESLSIRRKGATRYSFMFCRKKDDVRLYPAAGFSLKDIPRNIIRSNASFVSAMRQTNIDALGGFLSTMFISCNVWSTGRIPMEIGSEQAMFENETLRRKVESFLGQMDTGVRRLDISKIGNKDENVHVFRVTAAHDIHGEEYRLPIGFESNGTRQLITLLVRLFTALGRGTPFVYDELEHGLHQNIIPSIFDLFYSKETNPHNAQMICTSHADSLMTKLSKKQIFFVEKDDMQESELYSLDSIDGVRNDDNIARKYLAGAYGGVPEL